MTDQVDDKFYDRADEVIGLANGQCGEIGRGKVSASLMYATARFNAWVNATGCDSQEAMRDAKAKSIEYFTAEYVAMLEENLDDYIENFDRYMNPPESD
jgi:hypothetical protein